MAFPRIYFDLDGVLADFVSGALELRGKELSPSEVQWDFASQIGFAEDAAAFWSPLGFTFWESLNTHEDGMQLFSMIEAMCPKSVMSLLSSPCETHGCCDGKRAWVRRLFPDYAKKLFLGSDKSVHADERAILIDDHDKNCNAFTAAGGSAFLVPRPWNSKRGECEDGKFAFTKVFAEFMEMYNTVRLM